MKIIATLLAFSFSIVGIRAQQNIHLKINHKLGDNPLEMEQPAVNNLGYGFTFTRIDYYISSLSIHHDGGMTTTFPDVYILSKGNEELNVLLGTANVTTIESITFSIGVESPTNNEDPAQWPTDHPLNYQSPSMHWGWSSGYRFAAVEGLSGSNMNLNYQLHGLGNDNYFSQTIPVQGMQDGNMTYIELDADYIEALRDINLSTGPINHGTNTNDLTMLNNFKDYVFSPASSVVGIFEEPVLNFNLYPNPSKSEFTISGINEIMKVQVTDMTGRKILETTFKSAAQIEIEAPGTYIVYVTNSSGLTSSQKLIIQP